MKVIFLDIDGVLNTNDYISSLMYICNENNNYFDEFGYKFDPRAVNWLRYIINSTNAKIVISSSWRLNGKIVMCKMWEKRNLPGTVIGVTPYLSKLRSRGEEINYWLKDTKENIESYCIIDDDNFDILQRDNLVQTDSKFGLTCQKSIEAINILNQTE